MGDLSAGNSAGDGSNSKLSLERIKKQLSTGAGCVLLQGPLLKRSETLRKWNRRWFTLDPSSGWMEYRTQRGDPSPRGLIFFEADSTITLSPLNIHGDHKYDGCCFYIGTPHKKEYFLCAETQVAARAWVATLRAAAVVLKAHKEAVNSLSGNGSATLGTVAAVVAAANATAREAAEEIAAEQKKLLRTALNAHNSQPAAEISDNLSVMKETLRVKDEELNHLAKELRARDLTIKELVGHLSETADAASAAASATRSMDKERKAAKSEVEHIRKELEQMQRSTVIKLTAATERLVVATKARDEALLEAQRWQKELAKAREQVILMEAAVLRAEESAKQAIADGEEKVKAFREARSAPVASEDRHMPEERNLKAEDGR
ncbi:hypothetical protein O6H91_01G039400 [Diphasiastrum complanatum]|nr:hypothetical protein O6H91_01G039400 [Diphasiastrum complanatum]